MRTFPMTHSLFAVLALVCVLIVLSACAPPEMRGRFGLVDCSDLTKHEVCRDMAAEIVHRY